MIEPFYDYLPFKPLDYADGTLLDHFYSTFWEIVYAGFFISLLFNSFKKSLSQKNLLNTFQEKFVSTEIYDRVDQRTILTD